MGTQEWIVVGVYGTPASDAALDYAVTEVATRDCGLRVVHVMPPDPQGSAFYPVPLPVSSGESRRFGSRVISAAVARAAQDMSVDQIDASLLTGDRATSILRAGEHAAQVVLGNERHSLIERLVTGAVVDAVAARSAAPVVTVPPTWSASPRHLRVVVGVRTCGSGAALIRHAMLTAAAMNAELVVLHAWEWPGLYDGFVATQDDVDAWSREARSVLSATVRSLRHEAPDVLVDVRVEHGQAARLLARLGAEADLVIVERHAHPLSLEWLGGTTRAVLRECPCPVEVVPVAAELRDEYVLESHGALVP